MNVSELKAKKTGIKSAITKRIDEINGLIEFYESDPDPRRVNEILGLIDILQRRLQDIDEVYCAIENILLSLPETEDAEKTQYLTMYAEHDDYCTNIQQQITKWKFHITTPIKTPGIKEEKPLTFTVPAIIPLSLIHI